MKASLHPKLWNDTRKAPFTNNTVSASEKASDHQEISLRLSDMITLVQACNLSKKRVDVTSLYTTQSRIDPEQITIQIGYLQKRQRNAILKRPS